MACTIGEEASISSCIAADNYHQSLGFPHCLQVMDKGCVGEFGPPHLLLQNPASHLKRMVDKTGPDASKKLHQMAVDAHQRRQGLLANVH